MIVKPSFFQKKLRSLALAVFNKLENNNNTTFATNGEKRFINDLLAYLEKNLQGKRVLFDVGAHIGEFSLMLLDKSRRMRDVEIHVFEPTQSCFQSLQERLSHAPNIILNRKAVSDSTGTAEIFFDAQKSSLASLCKRNLAAYSIYLDQSEIVETIRLDDYIKNRSIKHIHFLKIDIEGHEMAAFRGLGEYFDAQFIDFIQFEYGGTSLDAHTSLMDFYNLFEKADFVIMKIMPHGLEVRPYYPWMDNFQYANYVAVSSKILNLL